MELNRLLEKLGRGQRLTESELLDMRTQVRDLEETKNLVKSWVNSGTSTPIFQAPIETIYSALLNEDTPSLTLPIPNNYKHLIFTGSGRTNGAGSNFQYLFGRYNSDSANNYTQQKFYANFTTLTGEGTASQSGALLGALTEGNGAANYGGVWFTFIPHYLSSFYKVSLSLMWPGYNATVEVLAGSIWKSIQQIRTITLIPVDGSSIAAGSVLSLYGLK